MKLKDILLEKFKESNHADIPSALYEIFEMEVDDFIGNGKRYYDRNKKFNQAVNDYLWKDSFDKYKGKETQQAKQKINTELDSMIKLYKKDINDKVKKLLDSIDKEVSNIKKHTK